MENPLYEEWCRVDGGDNSNFFGRGRDRYVKRFSWAIPTQKIIEKIAEYSPIVEIGAGRGYWAKLLQGVGADVVCYDKNPPGLSDDNKYHPPCEGLGFLQGQREFVSVLQGDEQSIVKHQDRALFLCWPPYADTMAFDCLKLYAGKTVIYIGEGDGGCTGCDGFHEKLEREFNEVFNDGLPQWWGIHDELWIYERK